MITNGLLFVLQGVLKVLLLPLEVINITIDFLASIPVVVSFLQVVAYILPWSNILPIIILTIALLGFKIVVRIIITIWDILPLL